MPSDRVNPPKVTVIGGCNMDILAQAGNSLVWGDSNPGAIHTSPGGVARNIAENLARLGLDTQLISAVGADAFGQSLIALTQAAGVGITGLNVFSQHCTSSYVSIHGPEGDMAIALNDMEILERLTPEVLQTHQNLIDDSACLVLDCNLSDASLAWLFQNSGDTPRFVDAVSVAKCVKLRPWMHSIYTLKLNRLEAQALAACVVDSVDAAKIAAVKLHAMGVAQVVISLGALGVVWCDGTGSTRHQAVIRRTDLVNSSGAGDALVAGLVFACLQGKPLGEAVDWAMACAEITLGSLAANSTQLNAASVHARMLAFAEPVLS